MLFKHGHIVANPGVMATAEKGVDLLECLQGHLDGDWGDLDEYDFGGQKREKIKRALTGACIITANFRNSHTQPPPVSLPVVGDTPAQRWRMLFV